MKILVTGATGFLGQFLCKKLESQGDEVTQVNSKNCDLTKEASLHQFDHTRFDRIFHLAAWTQAGDFCLKHPGEQWIINQKINTNMLSWWQEKQPQAKLICMGTSCSYDPNLPLTEENYLSGTPIDSLFTYAMTKRMLYAGVTAMSKQFGLDYLFLVPSTLYGPGYHTDGRQMHFIFDLMRKINRGKLYDEPVVLWGDGEQKRELVHVQDFVEVMLQLTEKESNTLINIGAGEEYSIKNFAEKICHYTGYPPERIQYDTTKYVGAKSKCLTTNKLEKLLPDFVRTPIDQGLQETTEWFKSTFHEKETVI